MIWKKGLSMNIKDFFSDDDSIIDGLIKEPTSLQRIDDYTKEHQTLGKFEVKVQLPQDYKPKGVTLLTVPETHLTDTNIGSRIDYVAEMKDIHSAVELAIKTLQPTYTVYMGEIYHRGFKTASGVCYWFLKFIELNQYTKVCCVKGNHEESFRQNNPFWYQAKGAGVDGAGVITLPNNFIVNDVAINFEHYGVPQTPLKAKTNIAFMHTDVMTHSIREYFVSKGQQDDFWVKNLPNMTTESLFPEYDIVFNGHMHKKCAFLQVNRVENKPLYLCYTSSLGRTNVTEVDDASLTKYMYLLDMYDGEVDITPIPIELPPYERCVNVQQRLYEIQKQEYQKVKQQFVAASKANDVDTMERLYIQDSDLRDFYSYISDNNATNLYYELSSLFERSKEHARNSNA